MDRTERLLALIALFLDAGEPISWAGIREAFPDDYGRGWLSFPPARTGRLERQSGQQR